MSYDVWIEEARSGRDGDFNYTSNLGPFFHEYGVCPEHDLRGRACLEVAILLELKLAIIERADYEALAARFDSPGGWGTVSGAIKFLRDIRDACRRAAPLDVVEVWA